MVKRMRWWIAGMSVIGAFQGTAAAMSDVELLLNKLVERGVLTSHDASELRQEMVGQKAANTAALANEIVPESSRRWKWSGDLRLRNESRNRTGSGSDVNRQRIRFRYGFEAKVSEALTVGARVATGSTSDPVSTNQSFNTAFNHKAIVLDRAYVDYAPVISGLSELRLTGGIIENPFWVVGPLVWDDDLNFDGVAVHLAKEIGPVTCFGKGGVFSLQTDIGEAASLWSLQGGAALKPLAASTEEMKRALKLSGAIAYHDYKNVTSPLSESTALTTAGGSKGNRSTLADLNLLNSTVEVASQYADIPIGVFGDWVRNTAVSSGNNGVYVGLRVGKARVPFDLRKGWEGGYFFERLEPDAAFGAFTDSDFGNGGTDHRGHVWWIKLAALTHSVIQLKYFNTQEVKGSKNHAETFQADWITKF